MEVIKCANCPNVMNSPISLPCDHSICQKHTVGVNGLFTCNKCGNEHQMPENGHFSPNEGLAKQIEANIGYLKFSEEHSETLNYCERLETLLDSIDCVINDPYNFTYEAITFLKNVV